MTKDTPRPLSYDGRGINGSDIYRSRIATFTTTDNARQYGPLFETAPEMHDALAALLEWGKAHTSPRDANSPHTLLVEAARVLTLAKPKP